MFNRQIDHLVAILHRVCFSLFTLERERERKREREREEEHKHRQITRNGNLYVLGWLAASGIALHIV